MFNVTDLIIAFLISFCATLFLMYPIKRLAVKMNVIDMPNYRKVHKTPLPRLGGLGIYLGTVIGLLYLRPTNEYFLEICIGAVIIIITGLLDDKFSIKPMLKLTGQIIPAALLIYSGLIIERITIPFFGVIELGYFSILITLLWIVGITNAINLIDGLDGLASGVSTIALTSIFIMAIMDERILVGYLCIVLIGSNLGFLFHNFHPAKVYMGDTGSLFLGYSIAVISILGLFKNITLFSFIIPVIVLAVPIFDTLFAMVRRMLSGEKIMMPDKKHIHHQLLLAGFSHKTSVLIIYAFSILFGALAILFSNASLNLTLIVSIIVLIMVHIIAELVGVVGSGKRPIINVIKNVVNKTKFKSKN
ncbi:undecaprenyl-phosphate alpha-N-acetylglucosaminyl 1-phosphate transferase [Virgibacillus profundi]|uniref:Undecaprenyl-phosphate alpha-N-acetylglucosaminyl 1-phosphate transferase n=1 Tax=Virgibacillus profundi TaxID=2024555 RepID=A0A2A2IHP6_9BACI|nr:MraY family glycosyltransferase [Virgibacillus profundi]PAV31309.1 undecaprenyl-phosphate alpha-N-acetylglucosaminyl 1-phosphate transferase [Virgibacillus profundi]PXY55494.1 undecaprenyl/decaprenyl-phosphate alpha-N-acetylglucosaminyl 1-phosphate transferase [Virgibacillus profundi]